MEITGVNGLGAGLATAAAPAPPDQAQAAENRNLVRAVKAVNSAETFGDQNELSFTLDRNTHLPVIRVVDRNTRKVIEQIPPEYVLRLAEELRKGNE
ncbi:MAG: flagellar protein FlaG [Candidatus Solibacter usitatus]|nr:flagellar protein FlaG [Candidatus Solibacter usitatus]